MSENEKKPEDQTPDQVTQTPDQAEKVSEPEEQKTTQPEEEKTTEPEVTPATTEAVSKKSKSVGKRAVLYVVSVVVVVLIVLGVLFLLEKEGRSSTNIFGSILSAQSDSKAVARVNGEKIVNSELQNVVKQFEMSATMGGADVTDPEVQSDIRKQAIEMLVNTTLLKQAASKKEITVTDEQVDERFAQIVEDVGGQEVLEERMLEIGIDSDRLRNDIRDELIIDQLLDGVFAEKEAPISDEEIQQFYDQASAEMEGNIPPLEEVREQIRLEISSSREQQHIQDYLEELKKEAKIEGL